MSQETEQLLIKELLKAEELRKELMDQLAHEATMSLFWEESVRRVDEEGNLEHKRLWTALFEYGTHTTKCDFARNSMKDCTCGLWKALWVSGVPPEGRKR